MSGLSIPWRRIFNPLLERLPRRARQGRLAASHRPHPGLYDLALVLASTGAELDRLEANFPTAGFATLAVPPWSRLGGATPSSPPMSFRAAPLSPRAPLCGRASRVESQGPACMRPRTHSHGCGRQPVGAVVKFWSSCGGKAWQLVAKRSRVEPARLRPAATTDDSRRRLSPLSHPGRLRFELGWLHPVSSRSRAEPDHREQRDHERPHACVLVATTTDPSACATERGRRYVRRGRMDYD